jgi:hypothetical protein
MPKMLDKPSDDEIRQWFLVDKLSTTEVAALAGVTRQAIWVWKKQLGIFVGMQPPPFTKEDLEYRYYVLGETQGEIGEFYGRQQVYISHWMIKWGLESIARDDRSEIRTPVVLTEEQEDLIRGTLFGDGHLKLHYGFGSGKNSYWTTEHGDKQRVYIQHLADCLHNYIAGPPFRYWHSDPRLKAGGNWSSLIRVRSHKFWSALRDLWYPLDIKIVPESELDKLNARSLAYFYADDGSKAGMASNLYSLSFTQKENDLIVDCLYTKFGLKGTVRKFSGKDQYHVHLDRAETQKFMEIIEPYLSPLEDIRKKLVPKIRAF